MGGGACGERALMSGLSVVRTYVGCPDKCSKCAAMPFVPGECARTGCLLSTQRVATAFRCRASSTEITFQPFTVGTSQVVLRGTLGFRGILGRGVAIRFSFARLLWASVFPCCGRSFVRGCQNRARLPRHPRGRQKSNLGAKHTLDNQRDRRRFCPRRCRTRVNAGTAVSLSR